MDAGMKRQETTARIDPTSAIRTKPRLIFGACCVLIAIVLSHAKRDHDLQSRTTVELRINEQWSPC
jgi:hypothetical protein